MKNLILITLILFVSVCKGQIQINNVKEGYYLILDETGNEIDRKDSEMEAQQGVFNYQSLTGKIAIIQPPSYRVDIENIETYKDTITLSGFWAIRGQYGNWFRHNNYGTISKVEIDSSKALFYQKYIKVLRTKVFGKESLKYISEPFQFTDSINRIPSSNSVKIQTFANEKHCVDYYLDGDEFEINASCNAGTVTSRGFTEYRHTNLIDSLQPNTKYKVKVVGTSINSGEKDYIEFYIKTNN